MLIVLPFKPQTEAAVWPGRRFLAVVDALIWPALLAGLVIYYVPEKDIALRGVATAAFALAATSRLSRAVLRNEFYRFTSWQLAKLIFVLAWIGGCIQFFARVAS